MIPHYGYDAQPGLCAIINNMTFERLTSLPGGQKDEDRLKALFTTLGFEVNIHQNLKAQGMIQTAESYRKMQHRGVFVLIILSHGTQSHNQDVVIGTDCKSVDIHQLKSFFYSTNCPSLHGVPKIFLVDADRGSQQERVFDPRSRSSIATSAAPTAHISAAPATDSAHFTTIYASTYGNSCFTTVNGSIFTQTLMDVITEATPDKSFTRIIQEVRTRIKARQTVESVDTLTQEYFIKKYCCLHSITNNY